MKIILIYLAIGVYIAYRLFQKGKIRFSTPYLKTRTASFLLDNVITIVLWPVSILLRVVTATPDHLILKKYAVKNDSEETTLTFSLEKGDTLLHIKDKQMQEIIATWCLSKMTQNNNFTIKTKNHILKIKIIDNDIQE